MRKDATVFLAALAAQLLAAAAAPAQSTVEITYEKFVLDNGLTLIVHEDHKAPIVAVNIWYHVGSKNEKLGRTGFAHLFEHLMFNGSEHYDDDYFKVLEPLGATSLNGTTNPDRTNYFQNVPTSALDLALWMESDRMGHLLGAITQAKLDEQRGVVQNEKRQGENRPYGRVRYLLSENTYPAGHPYSWTTIGSMEDLDAATLEDVREWFRTYYGPANATLVIAGDIDPVTAREKVERYFGDIPSGPPVERHATWIAKMAGKHRQVMQDRVPQARIYKTWNVPEWGSADAVYLDLAGDVLSSGKTSRLYKRLVYDERIATDVNASVRAGEIGGQFRVVATASPGVELAEVERAIDEEMARFLTQGPSADELTRVKTQYRARFVRGIERIGGFGGKSDVLAMSQTFSGRPDSYKMALDRVAGATAKDLQDAAKRWLTDGVYILEVHPFPEYTTIASQVDRSSLPQAGSPPGAEFPRFQRTTLSNGLKVILAERHSIPVINFQLLIDAGYAADQFGAPGTASLATSMLDEGTKRRSALQISDELARAGAEVRASSELDLSTVSLSALKENLDASLDLYADIILNPAFREEDFQRQKEQRLAAIQREKSQPMAMGMRVLPALLYGKEHAYGQPLTGTGTEESVRGLTRDELAAFHRTWFRPNNATLIVVGDATLAEIRPKLDRLFRDWRPGEVPKKSLARVDGKTRSEVYIIDRPGARQSVILAAQLMPPAANPDEIAIETMNTVLGGDFTARINMNLREDKHWSYGARTRLSDAAGQRPYAIYAPVQSDKTKEAMQEIYAELTGIRGDRPITEEELEEAKKSQTLTLPGRWETAGAVMGALADIVRFGYPDDYFDTYANRVRSVSLAQVQAAADTNLRPDRLVWVVIGDRARIEGGIRELGLGPVVEIDADGNPKVATD